MVGLVGAGQARWQGFRDWQCLRLTPCNSCGVVEVSVKYAIPIIMGANIGTSVTNTIAGRSGLQGTVCNLLQVRGEGSGKSQPVNRPWFGEVRM